MIASVLRSHGMLFPIILDHRSRKRLVASTWSLHFFESRLRHHLPISIALLLDINPADHFVQLFILLEITLTDLAVTMTIHVYPLLTKGCPFTRLLVRGIR